MEIIKMQNISIYGASGHAKVVIDCIDSLPNYKLGFIFDDNEKIKKLGNHPVFSTKDRVKLEKDPVIITIGDNFVREQIAAKNPNMQIANPIIHSLAICSKSSHIKKGSVVMPSSVINAAVKIGEHVIINTGAIIEHDCVIEDFAHISPNVALAGNVKVGKRSHVGIGAQVIQGIKIGKDCIIGAGAVIIKDVPDGATVVGNPGRILKKI